VRIVIPACLITMFVAALAGPAQAQARFKEFPIQSGAGPERITSGPDGNLWFTESGGSIGKITTQGVVTEYPVPTSGSLPWGITSGPDGALWFTEFGASTIGRITVDGTITEFTVPTSFSSPADITAGPDGNLWFSEWGGDKIGRVSVAGSF